MSQSFYQYNLKWWNTVVFFLSIFHHNEKQLMWYITVKLKKIFARQSNTKKEDCWSLKFVSLMTMLVRIPHNKQLNLLNVLVWTYLTTQSKLGTFWLPTLTKMKEILWGKRCENNEDLELRGKDWSKSSSTKSSCLGTKSLWNGIATTSKNSWILYVQNTF